MSLLKKPYEISVWTDEWDLTTNSFKEKRICVIGSDQMESQSRAIEPELTQNVNGTKKLTFKLYKRYIDTITGEKVFNPFVDLLVNEQKVKLLYDDEWFDFIIKNIQETSKDYLYTYSLEDALVNELSKNGFNVTLDETIFDEDGRANLGTANELATKVLKETDWEVAEDSEVLVQKVDDSLVYLNLRKSNLANGITIYRLKDQVDNFLVGVQEEKVFEKTSRGAVLTDALFSEKTDLTVLGFYSSCTGKPHRFQFIYVPEEEPILVNEDRQISNKDCQYYMDIINPQMDYTVTGFDNYFVPSGFSSTTAQEDGIGGVTLSTLYKGARYGFAQQVVYIPQLEKYVNLFEGPEYTENNVTKNLYYGYEHNEYVSPALTQNLIANTEFKSLNGWTGTYVDSSSKKKAEIENLYGYFSGSTFISAYDQFKNGSFDASENKLKYYLKITFQDANSAVINSGPFDNRTVIKNAEKEDEYAIKYTTGNNSGELRFSLQEYRYDSTPEGGGYVTGWTSGERAVFSEAYDKTGDSEHKFFKVVESNYSEAAFKKSSNVRLCIKAPSNVTFPYTVYLESIELFKAVYFTNSSGVQSLIAPADQAEHLNDRTINKSYYYFKPSALTDLVNKEDLVPEARMSELEYSIYKPLYNVGAEKVRTVNGKESNYFNILQSIAETFEAWLVVRALREDPTQPGKITKKQILFKNYIGKDNAASFRYGVNLKDIQRTFESKNIVSKLIVKQNSNEHAPSGFCSIARAKSNPSGESSIYDFQYYFNQGLLNARDYLETVYITDGARGPDVNYGANFNIQGYYPRLKNLNEFIQAKNEILVNVAKDLTRYKAELEVADAGYEAAVSGLEQNAIDFELTLGRTRDEAYNLEDFETIAERSDVKKLIEGYLTLLGEYNKFEDDKSRLTTAVDEVQEHYDGLSQEIQERIEWKKELNKEFFKHYARFIQEGTWIEEKYMDDELYYADALSVLYNSCYPQVSYSINVMELSQLEGYEHFTFDLGDKTYAEDPEFFGNDLREEVIISELKNALDDPTKNTIKVQNFKNQFQDLFQKITATVQQAKYSTGSYQKAVALAEANQARKQQFFTDALDSASARLTAAGQQSVIIGNDGLTVKSVSSPCDAIRMVGGTILLSKQDKEGRQKWVTGVTSDGISASLITAGVINAGEIAIMNNSEPVFRWDAYGLSAYNAVWEESEVGTVISGIDSRKFVRFDKLGIYGIDDKVDGANWHPINISEVDAKATFALTWKGLKVTGNDGVVARIGKQGGKIINITKKVGENTTSVFEVDNSGNVKLTGVITAEDGGNIAGWDIGENSLTKGILGNSDSIHLYTGNYPSKALFGSTNALSWALGIGQKFGVTTNGEVYSEGMHSEGMHVKNGTITCGNAFSVTSDGKVEASDLEITGGTISIKNTENETSFEVSDNGVLNATGANITGTIRATNSSFSGSITCGSGFSVSNTGVVTINSGSITIKKDDKITFAVSSEGVLTATSGNIGNWTIIENELYSKNTIDTTTFYTGLYSGTSSSYQADSPTGAKGRNPRFYAGASSQNPSDGKFVVYDDGGLDAKAAKIEGEITATGGTIGGLSITTTYLGQEGISSREQPYVKLCYATNDDDCGLWYYPPDPYGSGAERAYIALSKTGISIQSATGSGGIAYDSRANFNLPSIKRALQFGEAIYDENKSSADLAGFLIYLYENRKIPSTEELS